MLGLLFLLFPFPFGDLPFAPEGEPVALVGPPLRHERNHAETTYQFRASFLEFILLSHGEEATPGSMRNSKGAVKGGPQPAFAAAGVDCG